MEVNRQISIHRTLVCLNLLTFSLISPSLGKSPASSLLTGPKEWQLGSMEKNAKEKDNSINQNANLVNAMNEDDNLISEANGGPLRVIDPPPYQGPTMLVLILVFLCCFTLLLFGVACFSITWMQKRRKERQQGLHGEIQTVNGKLLKAQSGTAGLFRWPGLSIATGVGNGSNNGASHPSYDSGLGYVTVPNTG